MTADAVMASRYETVTTLAQLHRWADDIRKEGLCAFDTETTSLNTQEAELVGVALGLPQSGAACYIPVGHKADGQLSLDDVLGVLKPILENALIVKVGQNIKYDLHIMSRYGVSVAPVEDTMLMGYAMYAGQHRFNMDELSRRYLSYTPISFSEVTGKGAHKITFDEVEVDAATDYSAEDADVTMKLYWDFSRKLERDQRATDIYRSYDLPLLYILQKMEATGVLVDKDALTQFGDRCDERLLELEARAHELAGVPFNLASPAQVGVVLYDKFQVPVLERTDSGKPATSVDVLENITERNDVPERTRELVTVILEWRKFAKLKGTYVNGLLEAISLYTGRVHPSFMMVGTTTGRLACSEPNLQNVPIRTKEGKEIRKAFIASPGHKIIAADYSQIELRILAHVCQDGPLLRAFADKIDIHTMTAAEVWSRPIEDVDADMRRNAKAVNFGIVYGSSAFGLARNIGIPVEEAEGIIDRYFERFPGIKKYMQNAVLFARQHGFVETIAGRKIWLPDINHKFKGKRGHAERQAVNGPIQGTAADVMKAAMIDVDAMLREHGARTKMLLTVHDELVFESPDDEVRDIMPLIKSTMEQAYELSVPLTVDVKSGNTWEEAH